MMPRGRLLRASLAAPLLLITVACGPAVDLKQSVQVTDASSGWFDAGIVEGKNKVVPEVSFKLKKSHEAEVSGVALNVVFRHPPAAGSNTAEDWDEVFIQRADFRDADETELLRVRPKAGYTGDPPQSRLDILKHSQFRDVRAYVYAKVTSSQWVELGTIDVQRQLLTR